MIGVRHGPFGLFGQILAILLLLLAIEFCVSTLLYERASQFSVRDDEAHRLAEHIVIARKILSERPVGERVVTAKELTNERYYVGWTAALPPAPTVAPELNRMRRQIVSWEPDLANANLSIRLTSPGRKSFIRGALQLPDRTWMIFGTQGTIRNWGLSAGRILMALAPAVGLVMIGALLVRRALRPLGMLVSATKRVGFAVRAPLPIIGTAEARELIVAFNEMQDRIRRLLMERTEALAAVGHDLRTPISRLRLRTDAIENDDLREEIDGDLAEMEAMVTSLLAFLAGETETETAVRTDVAVLVDTLVDKGTDLGWKVEYAGPEHLEAIVRPVGLKRALSNLMENASHHADRIWVSLKVEGSQIHFIVEDDGPGIREDRLEDVLHPFTRLDPERPRNTTGLGLGLAIVVQVVKRDGGQFILENRAEGGLRATIKLPTEI